MEVWLWNQTSKDIEARSTVSKIGLRCPALHLQYYKFLSVSTFWHCCSVKFPTISSKDLALDYCIRCWPRKNLAGNSRAKILQSRVVSRLSSIVNLGSWPIWTVKILKQLISFLKVSITIFLFFSILLRYVYSRLCKLWWISASFFKV